MATQKMKANILLLFAVLLGISANASDIPSIPQVSSESSSTCSPQVCQFSLTSYSGTVGGGYTNSFKVGLSCPQESDIRATVVVFINDEPVASKVVTIKAGNDYSSNVTIHVGHSYNGKRYMLGVQ